MSVPGTAGAAPRMVGMYRILMVCTGNICRSVSAERMLAARLAERGLEGRVRVDSAGISDEEAGSPVYPDTARALAARGYPAGGHVARQVAADWLPERELILAMTERHARALARLAGGDERITDRILLYRGFDPRARAAAGLQRVPAGPAGWDPALDMADPWYGGPAEQERMLDEVEAGLGELLGFIEDRLGGPGDRPD